MIEDQEFDVMAATSTTEDVVAPSEQPEQSETVVVPAPKKRGRKKKVSALQSSVTTGSHQMTMTKTPAKQRKFAKGF